MILQIIRHSKISKFEEKKSEEIWQEVKERTDRGREMMEKKKSKSASMD